MRQLFQISAMSFFTVFLGLYAVNAEVPQCLIGYCAGDHFSNDGGDFSVFEQRSSDCGSWTTYQAETDNRSQYIRTGGPENTIYKISDVNYVASANSLPNHAAWDQALKERYGQPEHELSRPSRSEWRWRAPDDRILTVEIHFSDVMLSFDKFPDQHRINRTVYDYGLEGGIHVDERSCVEQRLFSD